MQAKATTHAQPWSGAEQLHYSGGRWVRPHTSQFSSDCRASESLAWPRMAGWRGKEGLLS